MIHDRYRQRLFAYTRQMLPRRQDAEDALQDVFVRAYAGLRASDRELALRAWLYRVAHNRCIDELRRPAEPPPELIKLMRSPVDDPVAAADRRESLRRLVADVRRLPDQQRSALLMRELGGMSYADLAEALGVSVPAVKSLLVRARVALAQALEARDTACSEIREELSLAHDRGVRPNATARRHMRDCAGCREFRHELRGVSRQFAALAPALAPLGVLANVLGFGGGASGSAAAGGGTAAAGGAAGTGGAIASAGALATGASHVATLIAATVVTAGGAMEIQHTITVPPQHPHRVHVSVRRGPPASQPAQPQGPSVADVSLDSAQPTSATASPPTGTTSAQPPTAIAPVRSAKSKADRAAASSAPVGTGNTATGAGPASGPAAIGKNGSATGTDAGGSGAVAGTTPATGGSSTDGSGGSLGSATGGAAGGAAGATQPSSGARPGSAISGTPGVLSTGVQPSPGSSGTSATDVSPATTH